MFNSHYSKIATALLCLTSLLCSCVTPRAYDVGMDYEVYVIPASKEGTVYELDGNYYVKGSIGEHYKRTTSGFSDKVVYSEPGSTHREACFLISIGNEMSYVKKNKSVTLFSVLKSYEPGEINLKKARPIARVRMDGTVQLHDGAYIIPTGKRERTHPGAYFLLPVAVVIDTAMVASAVALIVWVAVQDDDDDCCDHGWCDKCHRYH